MLSHKKEINASNEALAALALHYFPEKLITITS